MSIDVNVQNDLVIVTESSEDITVNVSNAAGPAGVGVPTGGTTGQVLKKLTNTDYDTYWALDGGGVPYSGATGDVNLGEFQLRAGQVTLDTTPTGTASVATTRWNDTTGVSETTLKGGSVILKNGVDLVARVVNKVTPNATLTKAAYQAVRISGAQGQRLAVALAQANNDTNSADTIGLVTETIATNQEGFIMTMGQLEDINTTGSLQGENWVDGDVLYLSPTTAGAITKVKPTGAGHIVVIGYVEYAHANNGKIYVKVMNGWELDELHDVSIVSPANNEALIYESSTALWKNKTIATALGYTPISGSGVTGQVAYWSGTNSQTGSSNFLWDNATGRLSILSGVDNLVNLTPTNSGNAIVVNNNGYIKWENASLDTYIRGSNGFFILNNAFGTQVAFPFGSLAYVNTGQNFAIGGTTDGGQRLQVYGDAFVKGSGNTSATTALTIQNSNGSTLFSFKNSGQLTLTGTTSNDTTNIFRVEQAGGNGRFLVNAAGQVIIAGDNFQSTENFVAIARAFNPTSGTTTHTTLFVSPTINQTGGANGITRGLYVNPTLTAAADWRSIEWSNNSGWGLYGAGTSANYLGGRLAIGSVTANSIYSLNVEGIINISRAVGNPALSFNNTAAASSSIAYFEAASSEFHIYAHTGRSIAFTSGAAASRTMTLTAAGRLLLGLTAESTFLLDVNGTARVSGNFTTLSTVAIGGTLLTNTDIALQVNGTNKYVNYNTSFSSGSYYTYQAFGAWDAYGSDAASGTILAIGGFRASQWVGVTFHSSGSERMRVKQNGQVRFVPLASAPASPQAGDVYYDSTTNKLCCYNGTTWNDLF